MSEADWREHLGTWELPDGGTVDVYIEGSRVICKWPRMPLNRSDRRYYLRVIVPVVTQRVMKRLGVEVNALWLIA